MNTVKLSPNIEGAKILIIIAGLIIFLTIITAILLDLIDFLPVIFLVSVGFIPMYFIIKRTEYIIKDDRIIMNRDIFGEKHQEIPFNKIQNTTVKKSITEKMAGNYGSVSISTAGSDINALKLFLIENPDEIHKLIVKRTDKCYEKTPDNSKEFADKNETEDELEAEYEKLRKTSEDLKRQIIGDEI
jgi:uncharacterized membrane protein YdbT with pleckstrin-like domain